VSESIPFSIVPLSGGGGSSSPDPDPGGLYGFEYGGLYGGIVPGAEDHLAAGVDRLLDEHKEQPNTVKLLLIYLRRVQEIENLLTLLLELLQLANARGFILDDIYGRMADFARRLGWTDDQFRFYLSLKIQALRSNGTAPHIIRLARRFRAEGSTGAVVFTPQYPAGYQLSVPDVAADLQGLALELISDATAAGVRGHVVFYSTGVAPPAFMYGVAGHGYSIGAYAAGGGATDGTDTF
jgi:hypothetical protein